MVHKPILIFAYGNLSRGDDALGPVLLQRLQERGLTEACGHPIRYLTDYQIQVEHVTDMQGCQRVLLIDAHMASSEAFTFSALQALQQTQYTTHGMTADTLLYTYEQVFNETAPPSYMLALSGEQFELGEGLSKQAQRNLHKAEEFLVTLLSGDGFTRWDSAATESL